MSVNIDLLKNALLLVKQILLVADASAAFTPP